MLHIDPTILLSQVVTFLIFLAVVWKASWKPLLGFLRERQDKIRQSLQDAEQMRLAASKLEEDYRLRLQQVEEQSKELISLAKVEGNRAKDEIVKNAQKEIEDMRKRAEEHLDLEREQLVRELRSDVVNLSLSLTNKIIGETQLSGLSEDRLQEILKELESTKELSRAY
jgi:F-type H+-transporting ATPase subunit b